MKSPGCLIGIGLILAILSIQPCRWAVYKHQLRRFGALVGAVDRSDIKFLSQAFENGFDVNAIGPGLPELFRHRAPDCHTLLHRAVYQQP